MTKMELSMLLAVIFTCERRGQVVGRTDVEAWFPLIGDLDFSVAREAVEKHFKTLDYPISVAKIRFLAGAHRVERDAADSMRVPDADPDDVARWLQAFRNRDFEPERPSGGPAGERLDTSAIGRKVPGVSPDEAAESESRPRRWWLKRRSAPSVAEPPG